MGEVISQKGDAVYDALIEFMKSNVECICGDVLEIGSFCGHFTRKLSDAFKGSIVFSVDVFDPSYDEIMGDLYVRWLNGVSQFEEYRLNIKNLTNVVTLVCDSALLRDVRLTSLKIAYIDGGHSYSTVSKDFGIAWGLLKHGGLVVFDDYDHDLPNVTRAINDCVRLLEGVGVEFTKWYLEDLNTFAIRKDRV